MPASRQTRRVRAAIALVLVALVAAAIVLNLPGGANSGSGKDLPIPPLLPDARVKMVDAIVAPAEARARRDANAWLAQHPARDDKAFVSFALAHVGKPPTGAAEARELAMLHRIDAHRTPTGIAAAKWLEAHGKKDVWKLYRKQYQDQVAPATAARVKAQWKATYKLAKLLAADGKVRFARPSPYIVDPTLHGLNQTRFGGTKKFSYPAKHALISFALGQLLAHYEPHRASEYRWMADEVSFSRMYAGGHYPSDVAAGAYLGTLIEQYELRAL
jgi:hypothetical protein